MFAQEHRYAFTKVLPKNTLSTPLFNVRYENNKGEGLKVAVVVSKKVDKRAVVRNRVKRQVLAILEHEIVKTCDLTSIWYIRRQALESDVLEKTVLDALSKIKNV